jgi:predicted RNase H-like nuclease
MTVRPDPIRVAGVDGCRAGWVVAAVSAQPGAARQPLHPLEVEDLYTLPLFADVLLRTRDRALVGVDMPIGLRQDDQPRACDVAARRLLGSRASSVFSPPVRPCLRATCYVDASEIQHRHTGKYLTRQSFFIMDKIRQVDDAITPAMQARVREIHPEISFSVLNGGRPTRHNKKRLAGRQERIALLSPIFPTLADIVRKVRRRRHLEPDDILDALVAAWTAVRAIVGEASALPQPGERDKRGLRMEILRPQMASQPAKPGQPTS